MTQWLPVILCGGSGTRLWPLSREYFPKQFVALESGQSLFQQTLQRLKPVSDVAGAVIVTHEEHRFLVSEQLRQIKHIPSAILLEPLARNTSPALTMAALWAAKHNPEALLLIMPSDHAMQKPLAFLEQLDRAAELAQNGKIVTFGIIPNRPETGFGYIKADGEAILAFVEKPDLETAQTYLQEGHYLWNSGMFVCQSQTWLKEIKRLRPDILQACEYAFNEAKQDNRFLRPHKESFSACPSVSIDYAVMESTDKGAVLPLDAGWSDVGSWDALKSLYETDANGNACQGDVLTHQASGNLLRSTSRLLTAVGVDNLLIVETADAVLVASQEHAQDVKDLVSQMREQQRTEAENHRRVARPWGFYETVDKGDRFQVKRITVNPGQALSKQMHHHRSEHWVVVKGTARVTCGETVSLLTENQSVYIPVGTVHRLENPGSIDLELIEVQSGAYLGEDDIVRFEDIYHRT